MLYLTTRLLMHLVKGVGSNSFVEVCEWKDKGQAHLRVLKCSMACSIQLNCGHLACIILIQLYLVSQFCTIFSIKPRSA
jgi:hypothetical protein